MTIESHRVALESPSFSYVLDTSHGLRAVLWHNHLAATRLHLGNGPELGVDIDAAFKRLPITGWRGIDDPQGFRKSYHRPEFDDSKWIGNLNPLLFWMTGAPQTAWTRTHLFVPEDCRGKSLTLVLGGIGLWDFRRMRVWVNGQLIGKRRVRNRWHEPGRFDIRRFVRFGQDNVLALELSDQIRRTARLDKLDPQHARELPWIHTFPPQFEQFVVAGNSLETVSWRVERWGMVHEGKEGKVVFDLVGTENRLAARVRYRWNATEPMLHKLVEISNRSRCPVRLMNIRLGSYRTVARVSEGEQGFPVYADDSFVFSLAHPAGWAMGQDGTVELRQHPGHQLAPGKTFRTMEAVLGTAAHGQMRAAFLAHVRRRMRRVRRGHDRAYALFTPDGSWKIPKGAFLGDAASESLLLDNLRHLAVAQQQTGLRFDFYPIAFWADYRGDLQRFDPQRFPKGMTRIKRALRKLGITPGLWLDSARGVWSAGGNPALAPAMTHDPSYAQELFHHHFCRAAEPAKSFYRNACLHHMRANGVRLFRFDDLYAVCYNPHHNHLPGLYSTEAIFESMIEFFQALDRSCPKVFLQLYWGYRSPWWLLHADTLFEPGLCVEGASPGSSPTLYARDGVNQGLDMAQWFCEDVPSIGKDSLGVWISLWPWNSMLGKERWQEGFVLDMCRGSLLAQIWSENNSFTHAERRQLKLFVDLLKRRPACFANPRFILGNPWKNQPYGYCCRDGERAFVALHNCTWSDARLPVRFDAGQCHDVYRWYPDPARLTGDTVAISLRPFEVVLLEIVPAGQAPTLSRRFKTAPMPTAFAEPSRELKLSVVSTRTMALPPEEPIRRPENEAPPPLIFVSHQRVLSVCGEMLASAKGGTLFIAVDRLRNGTTFQTCYPGKEMSLAIRIEGCEVNVQPMLGSHTYPSSWQGWRIAVPPAQRKRRFKATITAGVSLGVDVRCVAYFVPADSGA